MTKELHVYAGSRRMGVVASERGRLRFVYDLAWMRSRETFPLSLSMPLTAIEHGHGAIEPFLWGLLPDNNEILRRWGSRFSVSARNAFDLLMHVGEDCAGAVKFLPAGKKPPRRAAAAIDWQSSTQVAARIRALVRDHSATRLGSDLGQFSLAGAQPKTALYLDAESGKWGVPQGDAATTHILKPADARPDLPGFAENEHFCLQLAAELGQSAASSWVEYFDGMPVIVVERYDRVVRQGRVIRIHQEDMCQTLSRAPQEKYQNQGSPTVGEILAVIRQYASEVSDVGRFVDSLIFNWLVCGTDAHAKNYSLLIAGNSRVRLAPLYDLASVLPYPTTTDIRRANLAMKIGGAYRIREIGVRQWRKFAAENRLDETDLLDRIRSMANHMPDAVKTVSSELRKGGLTHPTINALKSAITERAQDCAQKIRQG